MRLPPVINATLPVSSISAPFYHEDNEDTYRTNQIFVGFVTS
jgi:hypothetical protein